MDSILNYPEDPNNNKNRLPEETELVTLRKIVQNYEPLIQNLDQKIEQGEKDCSAIQRRYDDLLRVIEGVRSELVAITRSVDIFKSQRALIQDHLDQVSGLIHPIRRCPSDILQCIFEWTYEIDIESFKASTALSHVCRRWREIALKTPYLWTDSIVSLNREPEAVNAFWSRTIERAKSAPMTITFQDMTGEESQWKIMEEAPLDAFTHIKHIEFLLEAIEATNRFHHCKFRVPTGRVDHLEICCYDGGLESIVNTTFLDSFPSLRSLTLDEVPHITFTPLSSISNITKLTIMALLSSISFRLLVTTFPNIKELSLKEVLFFEESGEEINLPKLQSFRISWCQHVPWIDLRAPSINNLSFNGELTDDIVAFISSHKSIQHLDTTYSKDYIFTIVANAPQLLELTVAPCEELCNRAQMKLSNLQNLALYHVNGSALSLDLFEQIVRSRFLPPGRKANGETEMIPSLTVMVELEVEPNELEWRASPLLSSASEVYKKIKSWDSIFYSYTFTWT